MPIHHEVHACSFPLPLFAPGGPIGRVSDVLTPPAPRS
jgi:hypothetical protein